MAWTVYGESTVTADLVAPQSKRVYTRVRFNDDIVLVAMRTWFIFYNDPVFTTLSMQVFANDETTGLPSTKLFDSTTVWDKAQIITLANGVKGIYFEFDRLPFQSQTYYHFIPVATGYTGDPTSHIAWRKAWPDPVYGPTPTYNNLGTAPFMCSFIGAEL